MANNPVVNTLTFTGSVAGQATIQAQGIAGGLTFLLPNTVPVQGQLMTALSINGNNVFLGFSSAQSLSNIHLSSLAQDGAVLNEVIQWNGSAWAPSAFVPGAGTVTSVAFTTPAELSIAGSPITTSGTLALSWASGTGSGGQGKVIATPAGGGAGAYAGRVLVAGDIPALPYLAAGTQLPITFAPVSNQFLTSYTSGTGLFTAAQASFAGLSGSLAVSQINSKRGNGGFVQIAASGTAGAAGDVVTFDANGNTVDSTVLLSSLAPLASPTFTGLVTLPTGASTPGVTMISDNQSSNQNAPIYLHNVAATQSITMTPNGFFGPQIQFTGQTAPYTVSRLTEVGAQGLYMVNSGIAISGNLGTSGQVLSTLGVDVDGGPAGLAWVSAALLSGAAFTGAVSVTGAPLTLSFGAGNALIVSAGQAHFQGNVWLDGGQLLDSASSAGTSGQVLTSTGSAALWSNSAVLDVITSTAAGTQIKGTGARGIYVNLAPGPTDGVFIWDNTGANAFTVGATAGGILAATSGAGNIALSTNAVTGTNGNVSLNANLHVTSANADVKGTITVTNPATSQTFTFARAYASAPVVVATPQGDPFGDFGFHWVTSTTTDFTVHVHTTPATTAVFNYIVIG